MKRQTVTLVIAAIVSISSIQSAFPAAKLGGTCSKLGSTTVASGKKLVCTKSGKKNLWKLAPVAPASTPQRPAVETKPAEPAKIIEPVLSDRSKFSNISACKLPNVKGNGDIYLGFPRLSKYVPSLGNRKSIVIFVDFEDLKAEPNAIETWKKQQIPYTEKALAALSYGKYSLTFDLQEKIYRLGGSYKNVLRSDFANVPGSTPALALEYSKLVREGVVAADPDIDFSKYDFVNIVTPTFTPKAEGGASGGNGFNADGKTSFLGTIGPIDEYAGDSAKDGWLLHETGHLLGLTHVYNYRQMMGAWDIMGNTFGLDELHGWQRLYLGWIEDSQVDCLSSGVNEESIHKLTPISNSDAGTKMVMIKLTSETALVVETIRKSTLNSLEEKDFGVVVYKVDTTLSDGQGSISIVSNTQENGRTKGGRGGIYGTMKPGESVAAEGITIKVLASVESGDFISIAKS